MALFNVTNTNGKLAALTNNGSAIAESITQDIGESDFESIREVRAIWKLNNISNNSTVNNLVTSVPIAQGDRLFCVKNNNEIVDFNAGVVTVSSASLIPNMTSNITPSGIVSTNNGTPADAYKLFDGNSDTEFYIVNGRYVQYKFNNNEQKKINKIRITTGASVYYSITSVLVEGSLDGVNFVKISNNKITITANTTAVFDIQSPGFYSNYRVTPFFNNTGGNTSTKEILLISDTGYSISTATIAPGEIPVKVFKFTDKIKFNSVAAIVKDIYYEYGTNGSMLMVFPIYHDVILNSRDLVTKVEFSAVGNEVSEITGQIFKNLG